MKTYTQEELNKVLELHRKWLNNEDDGERADLSNANLSYAILRHAILRHADLRHADLRHADLSYAILRHADLRWSISQDCAGFKVISVQVDTTRKNNMISYYPSLEIWTTGCFQGITEELKHEVEETHKDNKKLYDRYQRVIAFILNEAEE